MIMIYVTRYKIPKSGFTHLLHIIAAHLPKKTNYCTSVFKLKESLKKSMNFKEPVTHKFCEKYQQLLEHDQTCTNDVCE